MRTPAAVEHLWNMRGRALDLPADLLDRLAAQVAAMPTWPAPIEAAHHQLNQHHRDELHAERFGPPTAAGH